MAGTHAPGLHRVAFAFHNQGDGSRSDGANGLQSIFPSIQGELRLLAPSVRHARAHCARSKAFVGIRGPASEDRGAMRPWKQIAPREPVSRGNGALSRTVASYPRDATSHDTDEFGYPEEAYFVPNSAARQIVAAAKHIQEPHFGELRKFRLRSECTRCPGQIGRDSTQ